MMTQTQTSSQPRLKTKLQEKREARDRAIYNEYHALVANPEQSRIEVVESLKDKYGFYTRGTIYTILKRVENRIGKEAVK